MKLHSVCFGLLVIFFCPDEQPAVGSDFCPQTRSEIAGLQHLSPAETAVLALPRKKAILRLRRKYRKLCKTPQTQPSR